MDPEMCAASSTNAFIKIIGLQKFFGQFQALKDVSFEIPEGEFVCILGPSGCGKTTLLRTIAGLERQSDGKIIQAGKDISQLPVSKRDFGIVFQSYALFPNLTVADNVGYGLKNFRAKSQDISTRVTEMLDLMGLPEQAAKYPTQLSGGQQQRVALARALATSPGLLLLDEPLSALDAKVRERLRHEIKDLQRKLGVTTIMVTHDQEEALTMADRIVVMNNAEVVQIGTPAEIYGSPADRFVADFIGRMNFLSAEKSGDGKVKLSDGGIELQVNARKLEDVCSQSLLACVRPEDIQIRNVNGTTANVFKSRVKHLELMGSFYRATLEMGQGSTPMELVADLSWNAVRDLDVKEDNTVQIGISSDHVRIFGLDG